MIPATGNLLLGGGGGGGGSGVVSRATLTVTNAQILALPTTSLQIIAAPGAGKVIAPFLVLMNSTIVDAVTNIDGDSSIAVVYGAAWDNSALDFIWENSSWAKVSSLLTTSQATFLSTAQSDEGGFTKGVVGGSGQVNNGFYLYGSNGSSGDFTGGNAGNSLKVFVFYTTVTL